MNEVGKILLLVPNSQAILVFCRFVLGLTFLLSLSGKTRDLQTFKRSVMDFRIIPKQFVTCFIWLVLTNELLIVLTMLVGGRLLKYGFALAVLLLLLFTIAAASVLTRGIQTSCSCFGKSSSHNLSKYDIVRNFSFIVCGLVGWTLIDSTGEQLPNTINLMGVIYIGFLALVAVLILLYIQDILEIL